MNRTDGAQKRTQQPRDPQPKEYVINKKHEGDGASTRAIVLHIFEVICEKSHLRLVIMGGAM